MEPSLKCGTLFFEIGSFQGACAGPTTRCAGPIRVVASHATGVTFSPTPFNFPRILSNFSPQGRQLKVHFWPSNFCLSLVLTIELQMTIQLLKLFTIGHRAVLMGGFNFFYLQFRP
jgi:hypothetical protein